MRGRGASERDMDSCRRPSPTNGIRICGCAALLPPNTFEKKSISCAAAGTLAPRTAPSMTTKPRATRLRDILTIIVFPKRFPVSIDRRGINVHRLTAWGPRQRQGTRPHRCRPAPHHRAGLERGGLWQHHDLGADVDSVG